MAGNWQNVKEMQHSGHTAAYHGRLLCTHCVIGGMEELLNIAFLTLSDGLSGVCVAVLTTLILHQYVLEYSWVLLMQLP